MRGFFMVSVNVFILISGYWSINLKPERLIQLEWQTFFYSVSIFLLMVALGCHIIQPMKDFMYFLPILCNEYWFITCYMVLCLLSPLLNDFANTMTAEKFKQLLLLFFPFIYLWPTFSFLVNAGQFISDAGYGIINFCYLYMLGRYLHCHHLARHNFHYYFSLYFLSCIMLNLVQLGISWLLGFEFTSFYSYNTLFVFFSAVMLFLAFSKLDFTSHWINWLAAPCLVVYLIHKHSLVWSSFCKWIELKDIHGFNYVLALLGIPVLVYIACIAIERIRMMAMYRIDGYIIKCCKKCISFLKYQTKKE